MTTCCSCCAARGAWARTDIGGPRVRTRARSAEGRFVAGAGDIYVVDRKPHRVMITDELALPVDRAVGRVDYRYKSVLLEVFVRGVPPVAARSPFRLDVIVR